MHDSTRRIICRLAFIVLCLAPSVSLATWVAYRATGIHAWQEQTYWTETIYQTTGFIATLESVRHPTRARTLLESVTLRDPDGGQVVARIRVVEIAKTDHGVVAIASQPAIEPQQLRRLSELLYHRVLRGPRPAQPFQLLCGELTLHGQSGASTARDVRCFVASDRQRVEVTIDFVLAGFDMQHPAQVYVFRDRESAPASTTWQIRTGRTPLPCELVSDYLPSLQLLGDGCRFQGMAWIQQDDRGWDGEIAGQFLDADLERVLSPFPHKLSGNAEITLSHTSFRRGKLVEAAGAVTSNGGVVSRSLLAAAAEWLKLDSDMIAEDRTDTLLAYRQLAFGFQIDADVLQLSGLCNASREGVLLVGAGGDLLLDSRGESIPGIALARVLVPQSEVQVPATTATEQLLRALPLPKPTLPASATARQPYSTLQLR